jgi:hypothetical protein
MPEEEKQFVPITQAEAGYVELSPSLGKGQACATCRFFLAPSTCSLIENFPKAIQNTGYCDRFEEGVGRDAQNDMVDAISEGVAEGVSEALEEYGMMEMSADNLGDSHAKQRAPGMLSVLSSIWNTWRKGDSVPAFKDLGDGWWFASYTNNFEDVEKEILSMEAHDRYLARVQNGFVPMPDLWLMHTRGTKHGQAEWVWRQGHVMLAVGKYTQDKFGAAMRKYYSKSKPDDNELSHGFIYPRWAKTDDGVYLDYNTYEISVLPKGYATPANQYTSFLAVEDYKAMPVDDRTRDFLREKVGDEKLIALIEDNANRSEKQAERAEEFGAVYKEMVDLRNPQPETQEKDADYNSVDDATLEAIFMQQKAQMDMTDKLLAMVEEMPVVIKSYEEKIKFLESTIKDKDAQLNAVPKSVAAGNADASKLNGQEIAEAVNELEERKSGASNEPEDAISKMDRLAKEGRL